MARLCRLTSPFLLLPSLITNSQILIKSIIPELSDETRFFTFRPFYDHVEPFEVDPFPDFSLISEIIGEIQAFSGLYHQV